MTAIGEKPNEPHPVKALGVFMNVLDKGECLPVLKPNGPVYVPLTRYEIAERNIKFNDKTFSCILMF